MDKRKRERKREKKRKTYRKSRTPGHILQFNPAGTQKSLNKSFIRKDEKTLVNDLVPGDLASAVL